MRTDDLSMQLVAWLQTDDALAAARAELHRLGLSFYDPHDLLHDVAVRLLTAEPPAAIDNPAGYARRSLQRRAIDLLRGERLRPHEPMPEWLDEPDGEPGPSEVGVAASLEDAVRRGLAVALHRSRTWTVAAALGTLTLRVHPSVPVPDEVPSPGGSASAAQSTGWAGLWLAGERNVFGDGDAVRQARSRKLRAVERLLASVAGAVFDA